MPTEGPPGDPPSAAAPPPASLIEVGTPLFRRTTLALTAAGFSTFAVLYCVQPLMPVFAVEFGVSPAQSSLTLSLPSALVATGLLVASPVSEVVGRKAVMTASLFTAALLTLIAAAMPSWHGLLLVRALAGLAMCGVPAVAMTYVAEEMHGRAIGLAMGLLIAGNAVGGMSGRLVTGFVTDHASWRAALGTIGVLSLGAAVLFARSLPPSANFQPHPLPWRAVPATYLGHFRDPGLPWLFAEAFLLMGGFVTMFNYIGFRLLSPPYSLSQSAIGAIFIVYLVGMGSATGVGHVAGLIGRRRVLWLAIAMAFLGVGLTLFENLFVVIAGIVIATLGFFGAHSVASSWVGRRARTHRAQASAIYLFLYYFGSSVLGTAGGWFYAHAGWPGVAGFVAGLFALAFLVALHLARLAPLSEAVPARA